MKTPIYIYIIFCVSLLFACNEESIIEAGKSSFGIQGELEQCLADSVKLYETDGFVIQQIKSVPLVKSGSYGNFAFKGKVPQRGFYLLGTSTNNLTPVILGGEEELRMTGNGTNWAKLTHFINSPQNEAYVKLQSQIQHFNQRADSLMLAQQNLLQTPKTLKSQKERLMGLFAGLRSEEGKFRDSLKKAEPYFATVAQMGLYPIFDVTSNPKKYPNALHHFANEYFKSVEFKDDNLTYMTPLWEAVVTYTRTLDKAPETMMRKDSVYQFLDKLLDRVPKKSRTYRLVLAGIMKGLELEASNVFSKYSTLYEKAYPNEKQLIAENKKKFALLEEEEKKKQQFEIGAIPPDFELPDANGAMVKLSSLKGKVVLLNFSGSASMPCRRQIPNMLNVYKKLHYRGFDVMNVSIEKNKNDWMEIIKQSKIPWIEVSDLLNWECPVLQTYPVKVIPTNFLLDKEGKIAAKNVFGKDLEPKVRELLGTE